MSGSLDSGGLRPISRKTTPPAQGAAVVERPRVQALLSRLVEQGPLTCVYASAGSGKTTAIRTFADGWHGEVAWLTLDGTEAASGRFLIYLEEAIKRAVPTVSGLVAAAAASNVPHGEIAGMLAEAHDDVPLLIVLDNAERLVGQSDSLHVLGSFIRYLPPTTRLVIACRTELDFLHELRDVHDIGELGEEDLSFTVTEAEAALRALGHSDVDAVEAIVETNGWVTGVLFEAWRSHDHVVGMGGESDPLFGYLSVQITSQMSEVDRDFLTATALLAEVTPFRAQMLGVTDAAERMRSLRQQRLPVSWDADGLLMRCHNRFRDYLVTLFERRPEGEVSERRKAYAALLVSEDRAEVAIEEYFRAGEPRLARPLVESLAVGVIERGDYDLVDSWLARLDATEPIHESDLVTAQLMLALSREDFARGIALVDELGRANRLIEMAREGTRVACLMAWSLLHAGRIDEIHQILDVTAPGPDKEAVRYAVGLADGSWPRDEVAPVGTEASPLGALVARTHCDRGRAGLVAVLSESPWGQSAAMPWRAQALLNLGRLDESYELFQRLMSRASPSPWVLGILAPQVTSAAGEHDRAWTLLHEGRDLLRRTGSEMFVAFGHLVEAQLHLELDNDTNACRQAVARARATPIIDRYALLAERANLLEAHALLRDGDNAAAEQLLAQTVPSALAAGRYFELDAGAVHWAEAAWRVGKVEEADAAAEIAMQVASLRGTNYNILQALSEFTDVLTRQLDAGGDGSAHWRELGRALSLVGAVGDVASSIARADGNQVELLEFGDVRLRHNGVDVTPKLTKSLELMAYLTQHPGPARRSDVLIALFDGRRDESATAYLRQASLRLRQAVPDLVEVDRALGQMRINPALTVVSESQQLTQILAKSASQRGAERLALLKQALAIVARGEYLPGLPSAWVGERRAQLGALLRDAGYEASEIALSIGDLSAADDFAAKAIEADPYREAAWRVRMRVAVELGDHDRALRLYGACAKLLAELGVRPEVATTNLASYARR